MFKLRTQVADADCCARFLLINTTQRTLPNPSSTIQTTLIPSSTPNQSDLIISLSVMGGPPTPGNQEGPTQSPPSLPEGWSVIASMHVAPRDFNILSGLHNGRAN